MYFDGINLAEGSVINSLVVTSGENFPEDCPLGQLFYLTSGTIGLYIFNGTSWINFADDSALSTLGQMPFIVKTANGSIPNALVLANIGTGFVKNSGNSGNLTTVTSINLAGSDVSGILSPLRMPALSGDVFSLNGSTSVSLSNTGISAGTYNKVTVDEKGRVTSALNATSLEQLGILDAASISGSPTQDFTLRNLTLTGDLLPSISGVQNIGSPELRWSTIFVDSAKLNINSLWMGSTPLISTQGDTINITANENQSIAINTTGSASTNITSENEINVLSDINVQITSPNTTITSNTSLLGELTVSGDVTLNGNLFITGEQTIVNTTSVETSDNIIVLNSGEVGVGVTSGFSGIQIDRGSLTHYQIVFDETTDSLKIGTIDQLEDVATKNYVISGFTPISHDGSSGDSHLEVSTTANGFMLASDKIKLDTIATSANLYVHPVSAIVPGIYTKLTIDEDGHSVFGDVLDPADIPSLDWAKITSGKPTTIAGYGIVDALTETETTLLLDTKIDKSSIGEINGVASLDANGKVPPIQLPSFVDDVLEYPELVNFPIIGETGKIYVDINSNKVYRWSGSIYVEISAAPGSTDSVAEGINNLYFTESRAQSAVENIIIDGGTF